MLWYAVQTGKQELAEPPCHMTGKPFRMYEQQLSEDAVGVYCGECGEELEVYRIR